MPSKLVWLYYLSYFDCLLKACYEQLLSGSPTDNEKLKHHANKLWASEPLQITIWKGTLVNSWHTFFFLVIIYPTISATPFSCHTPVILMTVSLCWKPEFANKKFGRLAPIPTYSFIPSMLWILHIIAIVLLYTLAPIWLKTSDGQKMLLNSNIYSFTVIALHFLPQVIG